MKISEGQLKIVLDHLPYSELNPNKLRTIHWSERSRVSKIARDEIGWLAKAQWHDNKPMMKAQINYEFHIKDKRKRDLDNLLSACKPFTDGLIDAGVIFYDDIEHLQIGEVKASYGDKDETIIVIRDIEGLMEIVE